MPRRKSRLSREEEAMYSDCLRQLQDEGIPVEIPGEWQEAIRVLKIGVGAPWENMIFNLHRGGAAYYAIRVRLVALWSGLILSDLEITTARDNQLTPLYIDDRNKTLALGGMTFETRELLNPRIQDNFRFHRRGQVVEGWVLMSGVVPIPAEYRDFALAPFAITLTDQFGHEHCEHGELSVLRRTLGCSTAVLRGTGLDGLDATQRPRGLSPSEESKRRYLELVAQESRRRERTKSFNP